MKVGYLDCQSGISGDMFLAACVDAGADFETVKAGIDSLGTNNCRLEKKDVVKFGFRALKVDVLHDPEHAHRHLHHIVKMIDESAITPRQKELAKQIFGKLAESEAKVHGSTIEKVHFHEVGAIDSIADIVGAAIAWELLGIERLVCSPIPTGKGQIKIAHGNVSIPAPATAELLKGIPLAQCDIESELTTPTGAAIVATLASEFGAIPGLKIETIGIGAGSKDLEEQGNVLRLIVGEQEVQTAQDQVELLETNLDDVPGETVGYCIDQLFEKGALDAYSTSIQMKKNRPGVLLSVLCRREHADTLKQIIFRETETLGIRQQTIKRSVLPREASVVTTEFGEISGKIISFPNGTESFSPEHDHCALAATKHGVPLHLVYQAAKSGFGGKHS